MSTSFLFLKSDASERDDDFEDQMLLAASAPDSGAWRDAARVLSDWLEERDRNSEAEFLRSVVADESVFIISIIWLLNNSERTNQTVIDALRSDSELVRRSAAWIDSNPGIDHITVSDSGCSLWVIGSRTMATTSGNHGEGCYELVVTWPQSANPTAGRLAMNLVRG